jgi:outer membrane lipoprotein-sorting protein
MNKICLLFVFIFQNPCISQYPSGEEILNKIDQNIYSRNRTSISKMIVHGRRGNRTIEAKSWIQGTQKSFTEYLAPPREKGTKMLKLKDQLWTYSPSTDRIIQISGHMLRQSVMGSDLSYEDFMEDSRLREYYDAEVIGEEVFNNRTCWVMRLSAKKTNVAYHSRKIWVDQERYVGLKEERYAKSGKLLKTFEIKEVFRIKDRWYPKHVVFKDVLKSGKGTELLIDSIEFDLNIPVHIFSKAVLRK